VGQKGWKGGRGGGYIIASPSLDSAAARPRSGEDGGGARRRGDNEGREGRCAMSALRGWDRIGTTDIPRLKLFGIIIANLSVLKTCIVNVNLSCIDRQ
jgi:hypothetical protein